MGGRVNTVKPVDFVTRRNLAFLRYYVDLPSGQWDNLLLAGVPVSRPNKVRFSSFRATDCGGPRAQT